MNMGIKKTCILALSALAVAIAAATSGCGDSSESKSKSAPKFVAHRGYSYAYPDNTEESFRAAAQMDFYGIETDIHKTKDGYFICNHDNTVKYADGTELTIASTKRETLLSKPLKNGKTDRDAYLCTFETYLGACKEGSKVAVIELKASFSKSDIRKILGIVDREYDRKCVSFISFSYISLRFVQEEDPSIDLQYLCQDENSSTLNTCIKDGISADVSMNILTEELVETFHAAGLTVNVWTVDEEADRLTAIRYGVDYITTNLLSKD